MASQVEDIKWVPGTDFIVDGFAFRSPRCSHYFLTHFHSDHTVGLNKSFDGGVIYCSPVTAQLLVHDMGLKPQLVKPLAVGTPVIISGVRVTPLDANHCPGSVMFLFEVPIRGPGAGLGRTPHTAPSLKPGGPGSNGGAPWRRAAGDTPTPLGASGGLAAGREGHAGVSARNGGEAVAELADGGSYDKLVLEGKEFEEEVEVEEEEELVEEEEEGVRPQHGGVGDGGSGGAPARGKDTSACAARDEVGSGACSWTDGPTHNILHTGDCRWQPWMRHQPGLAGLRVDTLFLDTTYAVPKHTLPPQEEAIHMMVQAMREALAEEPLTVFLVAAYHIGKERAFLGAAQQLGAKVWCSASKRAVLRLLDLPRELTGLLADEPREAAVHVTGWGLRPEDLQAYLDRHPGAWRRAVGIRPTGWTLRRRGGVSVRREGNVTIIGVPYSEHSSWTDLCDAVAQLRPRRLVPTVNASTPGQRRALVDRFAHLMDLSADRSRLDVYLSRGVAASGAANGGGTACQPAAIHPGRGGCGAQARCHVDLAAVDLAEQAHILAELQQQQQQLQQQRRQQEQEAQHQEPQPRCRRAPSAGRHGQRRRQMAVAAAAGEGAASEPCKRQRRSSCEAVCSVAPPACGGKEQDNNTGATPAPAPAAPAMSGEQRGDWACGCAALYGRQQEAPPCVSDARLGPVLAAFSAGPKGTEGAVEAEGGGATAAACAGGFALPSDCVRGICVIDLTLDDDGEEAAEEGCGGAGNNSALVAFGCAAVRSAGLVGPVTQSCAQRARATPMVAGPKTPGTCLQHPVAPWQTTIRRFFAPIRRATTGAV